jgi:ectoine hydroxylase-related dioxygenase (phytanoyl-CoA dioxygenase family)
MSNSSSSGSPAIAPDLGALAKIRELGFAVVERVLDPSEIPRLRALLERLVAEDLQRWSGRPYVDAGMVHNPFTRAPEFAGVLENPILHAYLSDLLGPTCTLYAYTTSTMPPHGSNYSHRIHNDCPRFIPGYISNVGVILPLDDFTSENGATYFLPGSFSNPIPPTESEFFSKAVRVFPRAGDAVFFNARTYHVGGENRTGRSRHALTLNVCRSFMRQRFDYPRLVSKEILATLGDTGKRFLGFNVRVPTSLEEYYLPEGERLYKAGQG